MEKLVNLGTCLRLRQIDASLHHPATRLSSQEARYVTVVYLSISCGVQTQIAGASVRPMGVLTPACMPTWVLVNPVRD